MNFFKITLLSLLLLNACLVFAESSGHQDVSKQLHLPDGFKISIYAGKVPNARSLALGDNGVVFIGTASAGKTHKYPSLLPFLPPSPPYPASLLHPRSPANASPHGQGFFAGRCTKGLTLKSSPMWHWRQKCVRFG